MFARQSGRKMWIFQCADRNEMNEEFLSTMKMETIARKLEPCKFLILESMIKQRKKHIMKWQKKSSNYLRKLHWIAEVIVKRKRFFSMQQIVEIGLYRYHLQLALLNNLINSFYMNWRSHYNNMQFIKRMRPKALINHHNVKVELQRQAPMVNAFMNTEKKRKTLYKSSNSTGCWNCGTKTCWVTKCLYPKKCKKMRINRIKYFQSKKNRQYSPEISGAQFEFSEENINDGEADEDDDISREIMIKENDRQENQAEIQHLLSENIIIHERHYEMDF